MPHARHLGLHVILRWCGDMHAARFLSRPEMLRIGPDDILAVPPDVLGGRPFLVLAEPHPQTGFALRLDQPVTRGVLHLGQETVDYGDLRRGVLGALVAPVLPMQADTWAELEFGDFQFTLRMAPVPARPRRNPWRAEHLPLLLCFLGAAAVVLGPLWAAAHAPPARQHLAARDGVEDALQRVEPVAFEWNDPQQQEPDQVVSPLQPPAPPTSLPVAQPTPRHALPIPGSDAPPRERVRAAVQEHTRDVDRALQDLGAPVRGLRLWQPGDDSPPPGAAIAPDSGADLAAPHHPGLHGQPEESKAVALAPPGKIATPGPRPTFHAAPQQLTRISGSGGESAGELPLSVIRATIAAHMGGLRACYQRGLQENPSLAGRVRLAFLIQPGGEVLGARIERSSLAQPDVEDCILQHVRVWHFPPASGGGSTEVHYPLTFASR